MKTGLETRQDLVAAPHEAVPCEAAAPRAPAGPPEPVTPLQRRTRLVLGILLLAAGIWTIRAFLPALVWAVILALATWPLYRRLSRRSHGHMREIGWPALVTLAVALLFMVPLALAALQLVREAHVVFDLVEEARRSGLPVPAWLSSLPVVGSSAAAWWQDNLANSAAASELIERMNQGAVRDYTRAIGGQLVHRSIIFGFTILILFFLYRDGEWLAGELVTASHRAVGPHGERVGRQMVASVHGTVDGLVLVGLGEGVLIGLSYWLAGVPHPTLLGAATAIGAMIPFGAAAVFGSAALYLLASGATGAAIGVLVFGAVVVFVADHAIRPALIGGATKLPFVWVLLGILGGVETFGLLGLFLGPALMAALHLLWRDWTKPAPTREIVVEVAAPPPPGPA